MSGLFSKDISKSHWFFLPFLLHVHGVNTVDCCTVRCSCHVCWGACGFSHPCPCSSVQVTKGKTGAWCVSIIMTVALTSGTSERFLGPPPQGPREHTLRTVAFKQAISCRNSKADFKINCPLSSLLGFILSQNTKADLSLLKKIKWFKCEEYKWKFLFILLLSWNPPQVTTLNSVCMFLDHFLWVYLFLF